MLSCSDQAINYAANSCEIKTLLANVQCPQTDNRARA